LHSRDVMYKETRFKRLYNRIDMIKHYTILSSTL